MLTAFETSDIPKCQNVFDPATSQENLLPLATSVKVSFLNEICSSSTASAEVLVPPTCQDVRIASVSTTVAFSTPSLSNCDNVNVGKCLPVTTPPRSAGLQASD